MDTTKAAEVKDCDTTGMVNEQLFLRIRLADKRKEKQARENVFLIRQRIQQLLTQGPGGSLAIPRGNLATPRPLMVVPGGNVNPGGNMANPGGYMANAGGSMNPSGNLATPRPLMSVPDPTRIPTAAPKGDQGMMPYWVQFAVGPQLFMVPMIGGQPSGYPRMVNASYPGPNLNPYLGSSFNPNIRVNPDQSLGSSVNTSPDLSPELSRRTQNPKPLNPNATIFQPRQWQ
jgi:hypothetical protein